MTAVAPKMIAAAWQAWQSRHGGKLGPALPFERRSRPRPLSPSPHRPFHMRDGSQTYLQGWSVQRSRLLSQSIEASISERDAPAALLPARRLDADPKNL